MSSNNGSSQRRLTNPFPPNPDASEHDPSLPPTPDQQQAPTKKKARPSLVRSVLRLAARSKATDVHIRGGQVPMLRVRGSVLRAHCPPIESDELRAFINGILTPMQKQKFEQSRCVNVGYGLDGDARFRCNISYSMGEEMIIFRQIPKDIPSFEELQLPAVMSNFTTMQNGLILVTGKAGSGKSTTLAAFAEYINERLNKHIVTIEDPIEYQLMPKASVITQKELGSDVNDYAAAAREVLRQDPDIIIIGEIRDSETAHFAMTAAETGHLVLSTLHSVDALETINRMLSLFEPRQHPQVRSQLASVLRAVVSQKLIPREPEPDQARSLIPVFEVMIPNERIKKLLLDPERTREILGSIEEGAVNYSMQSFDQDLIRLYEAGKIDLETAKRYASRPGNFDLHSSGIESMGMMQWGGQAFKKQSDLEMRSQDARMAGHAPATAYSRHSESPAIPTMPVATTPPPPPDFARPTHDPAEDTNPMLASDDRTLVTNAPAAPAVPNSISFGDIASVVPPEMNPTETITNIGAIPAAEAAAAAVQAMVQPPTPASLAMPKRRFSVHDGEEPQGWRRLVDAKVLCLGLLIVAALVYVTIYVQSKISLG